MRCASNKAFSRPAAASLLCVPFLQAPLPASPCGQVQYDPQLTHVGGPASAKRPVHSAWLLVLAESLPRPTDHAFLKCSPSAKLVPPEPCSKPQRHQPESPSEMGLCRSCAVFPGHDLVHAVLWRCVSMPLPAEVLSRTDWSSFLLTGLTLCRLVANHEGQVWIVPEEGPPIDQQGQPKWPLGWPEVGWGEGTE